MKAHFVLGVLFWAALASCQETSKVEVFGGYSLLHVDTEGASGSSLDALCNSVVAGLCPSGTFNVHPNFNGWNASVQGNVTKWLGLKADFSGHYRSPVTLSSAGQSVVSGLGITGVPPKASVYTFVFGPVAYTRISRYTPFAHALFGSNRASTGTVSIPAFPPLLPTPTSFSISDTAFAMAFGGGLDWHVSNRIAVRVGQFDYLYTKHNFSFGAPNIVTHQNNFRVSAGIVFAFGGKREPARKEGKAAGQQPTRTDEARSIEKEPTIPPSEARPMPRTSGGTGEILELGLTVKAHDSAGCEIVSLVRGRAGSLAGLQVGDVITYVEGKSVKSPADLAAELSGRTPGDKIQITYMVRGYWQAEAALVLGSVKQ